MQCPYCKSKESKVIDKRTTDRGNATRRRRQCLGCSKRFTTYERSETLDLFVVKKDGQKESFDRHKLLLSLSKACEKRPIEQDKIDNLVGEVLQRLIALRKNEVESHTIGEVVMNLLKNLDDVAYIRFASVYREFKDIHDFQKEVLQISSASEFADRPSEDTPSWLSVKEAVATFGLPERTLRRYISQRKVRSRLENRVRLVYANDIRPPKNDEKQGRWVDVKSAVSISGMSERTIRRHVSQGKIKSSLVNGKRLVYVKNQQKNLAKQTNQNQAN